jgi:hypothetical protein
MKKKTKPKKKTTRKSPAKSARSRITKPLHTAFMRDFAREFRKNPTGTLNWPGTAQGQQLADEFNLFSRVLLESVAGHRQASTVAVTTANGALHARLVAFLDGYKNPGGDLTGGWPKKDASVAAKPGRKAITHKTVRLWEVAIVLQDLLGGMATTKQPGDGSGDPPRWPPHGSF